MRKAWSELTPAEKAWREKMAQLKQVEREEKRKAWEAKRAMEISIMVFGD